MKKNYDIISTLMIFLMLLSLFLNNYMIVMKNRISKLESISAYNSLGNNIYIALIFLLILTILIFIKKEDSKLNFIAGIMASFYIPITFFLTGKATDYLIIDQAPNFRVTFGLGIYLSLFASYSIIIKCTEKIHKKISQIIIKYIGIFFSFIIIASGNLNNMSIFREYFARQQKFHELFIEHIFITYLVILLSILIGLPIGYLCHKNRIANSIIMGFLNINRSIPSIALMMVMMIPLSLLKNVPILNKLGIKSFGFTPVFLAMLFYALFQIINSFTAGMKSIEPDYTKVAKAMGMTNTMIIFKIELPLIFPVLLSGIRISMIASFTTASIGTMVGFGGLGTFIMMGGGGAIAIDLILLGAVPIMAMIFISDAILNIFGNLVMKLLRGNSTYTLTEV